ETVRLLGSMILARVWQAATARARIPADRRRDCQVVLDECQNFLHLASSLDTMLAEARKYRLSLVLAHQNLAQFPRDLPEAVSANARNKGVLHLLPARCPGVVAAHAARVGRARPVPSRRLHHRPPPAGPWPAVARVHHADPTTATGRRGGHRHPAG